MVKVFSPMNTSSLNTTSVRTCLRLREYFPILAPRPTIRPLATQGSIQSAVVTLTP